MRDPEAMEVAPPEEEAVDGVPCKEEAMEVDQLQVQPLAYDFIMSKVFSKKKVKTSARHGQESRSSEKSKVAQMPPDDNRSGRDRTGGFLSGEEKTNGELLSSTICLQLLK